MLGQGPRGMRRGRGSRAVALMPLMRRRWLGGPLARRSALTVVSIAFPWVAVLLVARLVA